MSVREVIEPDSDSTAKKQANRERIAAVNHWRGQCLDNFARAEQAIIRCTEVVASLCSRKIEEAAAKRTQMLRDVALEIWPNDPAAKNLSRLLDTWSIREKERNDLVHGKFTIRAGAGSEWQLVNELDFVKKGVVLHRRAVIDKRQADAFLAAIQAERRQLEAALTKIPPQSK